MTLFQTAKIVHVNFPLKKVTGVHMLNLLSKFGGAMFLLHWRMTMAHIDKQYHLSGLQTIYT